MICTVVWNEAGIVISTLFAVPVFNTVPYRMVTSRTRIWVLLCMQAAQIDGTDKHNVLLTQVRAFSDEREQ
jgi:hypothetical protein